jgi:hypothetical protein
MTAATSLPDQAELEQMARRFAPTRIDLDLSHLDSRNVDALKALMQAGYVMDRLFLEQLWSGNPATEEWLRDDPSPLGEARRQLFALYKGPWSDLDNHAAFLPDVPAKKPASAAFYPEDLTRDEFERWVATLNPAEADVARGFYSVIRRTGEGRLTAVPYSTEYAVHLSKAAAHLRDAARLVTSDSMRVFLEARADAFLSNDYFASDIAWMDVTGPLEVTIGPYETYNDELFGYKAGFEAYICVTDQHASAQLDAFTRSLQLVEDNLPIPPCYRNPKLAAATPISVVNEVLCAGDACHGVQTAAFNLPNDERVILQKGSKKVMLRNVQQAKFDAILTPISALVLSAGAEADLSFEWFFNHILAHEIAHGIGPHEIHVDGRKTSVRAELKELYSAIEEAKADITALFMLQFFFDRGILVAGPDAERQLYTTFLASAFRTLRFGAHEAHGRGMAMQLNFLLRQGGFVALPGGRFAVDRTRILDSVRELTSRILIIEATGDYHAARNLLDDLSVIGPDLQAALDRLDDIPVDIAPRFVTAERLAAESLTPLLHS